MTFWKRAGGTTSLEMTIWNVRAGRQDILLPALKHGCENFGKFADAPPHDAPLGVLLRLEGRNFKRMKKIFLERLVRARLVHEYRVLEMVPTMPTSSSERKLLA